VCLCLSVLVADSMKPNELKQQLEMKHSEMKKQPEEYFRRKFVEIRIQQRRFFLILSHVLVTYRRGLNR
jgi:hypothetical protein